MSMVSERVRPGRRPLPQGEKMVSVGALIRPEEKLGLEELADRERLTVSGLIREAIRRLLKEEGPEKSAARRRSGGRLHQE